MIDILIAAGTIYFMYASGKAALAEMPDTSRELQRRRSDHTELRRVIEQQYVKLDALRQGRLEQKQ